MTRGVWGRCWHGTEIGSAAWLRCGWIGGCKGGSTPSDVIQEAYLEASVRLAEYLRDPSMPFFLWLRFLTGQKLVTLHRHHLGVQMRGAGQEVALCRGPLPEASSAALAAQLLGHDTRPSEAAVRAELKIRVQDGAQQHGPTRSRGAGLAPLRAIEPRRDCPGAGSFGRPPPASGTSGPWNGSNGSWGARPVDWED